MRFFDSSFDSCLMYFKDNETTLMIQSNGDINISSYDYGNILLFLYSIFACSETVYLNQNILDTIRGINTIIDYIQSENIRDIIIFK